MSYIKDIMLADFKENSARYKRYWESSSLPRNERLLNRPKQNSFRRDRVLVRLAKLSIERATELALQRINNK